MFYHLAREEGGAHRRFDQIGQNAFQTQLVGRFRVASRGSPAVFSPEMKRSRGVDSDSISQSSQTRLHHRVVTSQSWSDLDKI